ncbi:LacI family DNA-binding transcriptional regulator [Paramicrobacterium agarici]|uniref:LacI family DNA-binding transcriptional regulator n=1 Tax=Paramicrobacterium agarici TaxID=630514 RepID=UPI00117047F4|nr:LacI family DNA-binding transcriptional regulator [Microbacterium agarici]TQO23009.1 LacI family transcriptional regulator [Microbacterium agarici]
MTSPNPRRMTQRRIAELAGVSQAAVSLVLSGRTDTTTRLSEETRNRVLDVIRDTSYAADPAARMLAGKSNNILGVFTYESAFPAESSDFYAPLLAGVEAAAEELGTDLLMFTSARSAEGPRKLLREGSRLRVADGCVLLGRQMDGAELARLVEMEYPFVAVGRRDGDERIPYVGADYATAVTDLVFRAVALGHERFFYLRLPFEAESTRDRRDAFSSAIERCDVHAVIETADDNDVHAYWRRIVNAQSTVVFIESPDHAERFSATVEELGVSVPRDISVVTLGEHARPRSMGRAITRLVAPRREMGTEAVRLLFRIMTGNAGARETTRVLLPCAIADGDSLASAR